MESINQSVSEHEYFSGQVIKKVIKSGSGEKISQGCKIQLSESIYSDSAHTLIYQTLNKSYKIIFYPELSSISAFDYILLTMQEGDEVWIRFPYTIHNIPEACWETIWYHIIVHSVDSTQDLLSLPQFYSFLREHQLGPDKGVKKRVTSEGIGKTATVNSRVLYSCEMILENGCVIENVTGKAYTLTRNISPGMHKGIHMALLTMRLAEKVMILLSPGYHVCEKFKANVVWCNLILENIEFCNDLVYPQNQNYIEEVVLKPDRSVVKRTVKMGSGVYMDSVSKIWIEISGRLEDGYQFQKPKEEVLTLNGSKIYSEGLLMGVASMKRNETAWIKASPDNHIYKEGYEHETLWFQITIKEYIEHFEKILPSMPIDYKLELSQKLLEIAKRLFSSGTKKECKTIYNDIITALQLKKGGFSELSDDLKPVYIDVRGRAMMNISVMLIKEVENSEKEDLKIKTAHKIIEYCNELIKLHPLSVKAFYRKAQALALKKELNLASNELKKVLEIDPKNRDALAMIQKINGETKKTDDKEKKIYQGIFNGNRWIDEAEREKVQESKRNEIESKAFEEWKKEMKKRMDDEEMRKLEYENMIKQLEKGVIIDTNDSTDPVTDMILLDN